MSTNLFIELLQVALGTRDSLSRAPSVAEWRDVLTESHRQAVLGIILCGIEKIPKEQQPSQDILFRWIGLAIQIEQSNTRTSKACKEVVSQFEKDGFDACVLKGQANHRYYPKEMGKRRNCGDVDIWVVPREGVRKKNADVRRVLEYVDAHWERTGLCWLHSNFTEQNGVPIEVHFRPSFMNEPCKNRSFLRHFSDIKNSTCCELIDDIEIPALRVDEDVIYQMNHIYRHLLDEGIGLRQIIDYYWLLLTWKKIHNRSKEETMTIVSKLGMKRFSGALMFVLREICGMKDDLLLCPASAQDGQFLLSEIMLAGNFGHNDPRMGVLASQTGIKRQLSQAGRRFKRNMRFLTSYPGEVIWEPFARMWHFAWKKLQLWRL